MRKLVFALVISLTLLSTFTIGASAHSAIGASARSAQKSQNVLVFKSPVMKITPNSSGGGCSQYRTNATQDISVKACISYTYPYLYPDSYASFFQHQAGGVNACSVQFFVYRSDGYVVDNQYKGDLLINHYT